ncbi:MAG: flagellar assembly protein FliW [Planctomycetota bacterium]
MSIDEDRLITFSAGLLGFSAYKTFALLKPDENGAFLWLQSLEAPELAFVVTDPALWIADFQVPIRREQMEQLALESVEAAEVFVIVNRYGEALTANLQGPLILNPQNRRGVQLVLADKRWTTRHEIVQLGQALQAASA